MALALDVMANHVDRETQLVRSSKDRGRRFAAPGLGFKVKIDEKWKDYKPELQELLKDAYTVGVKSVRCLVHGHMHKFDFGKNLQSNLNTLTVAEIRPPRGMRRSTAPAIMSWENVAEPLTKGRQSLAQNLAPKSVYVIRVPPNSSGSKIVVPHPRKLGKLFLVEVPAEAEVGQPLFVPVPYKVNNKVKCAVSGAVGAVGSGTIATIIATNDVVAVAGAAGGLATAGGISIAGFSLGGAGPALVAGAGVATVVAASAAAVHYASRNPRKAATIGALSIGALGFVDHAMEVGVAEAISDTIEGGGEVLEGIAGTAQDVGEGIRDFGLAAQDVAEDFGRVAEDTSEAVRGVGHVGEEVGENFAETLTTMNEFLTDLADIDLADGLTDVACEFASSL